MIIRWPDFKDTNTGILYQIEFADYVGRIIISQMSNDGYATIQFIVPITQNIINWNFARSMDDEPDIANVSEVMRSHVDRCLKMKVFF